MLKYVLVTTPSFFFNLCVPQDNVFQIVPCCDPRCDPQIFEEFGHVIYDEAHHLSAEVFSQALPKTACKYLLGLSATPHRKDGLTKVFEWYIGDIAFSMKRKNAGNVVINNIYFECKVTWKFQWKIYRKVLRKKCWKNKCRFKCQYHNHIYQF